MPRRAFAIAAFVIAVAGFASGVWWLGFTSSLAPLADRGRADLSLAADRLVGQLQRFRQVAVLLADHPTLMPLADGAGDVTAAEKLLLETADKTGTLEIVFVDNEGLVLASSLGTGADGSENLADAPYFKRAMQGAMGSFHAQQDKTGQRVFYFAAPVLDGGAALGAVIVKVDMEAVEESDWRGDPQVIYFTDDLGVIFVSNRSELLLRQKGNTAPGGTVLASATGEYRAETLRPFFDYRALSLGEHDIWLVDAGRYIPRRAMHMTQPLPIIGMTAEVLIGTAQAERIALLQALAAAALCLAFGAMLFVATERRRALALLLKLEAEANAALEARVEARTRELSAVNADLRHEITEREDAEAALKKAQSDLVQAGKLNALGQMSAGISHELNQPLMAIRSFAENGETFLARGNTKVAAQNLSRISDLARRMGRIIKNLRSFAKQENESITNVDIGAVVEAVLEISENRFVASSVNIGWRPPMQPIMVRGGEVRLQQVILNLVSNAIDAMEGRVDKHIAIDLSVEGNKAVIELRDTGPGIDEPEKIFDPFYSTKEVGQSEGMGLGLSISYGLVQSFGGAIRGRNHPEGGAVFRVELTLAEQVKAA